MLRMQRREIAARRVHAVLAGRRSAGGLQESGLQVQGLHGGLRLQDINGVPAVCLRPSGLESGSVPEDGNQAKDPEETRGA